MLSSRLSRAFGAAPLVRNGRSPIARQMRWSSSQSQASQPLSRIERIEARLPKFLQRYVRPLRNAPISHITAFLILHEITAIVPIFLLAGAFHKFNWLPPYFSEGYWVKEGVEKFGRYARRKGWMSDEEEDEAKKGRAKSVFGKWFPRGEGSVRLLVEVATAYAITKALLPLRLGLSLWLTPRFAAISTLPVRNFIRSFFVKSAPKPTASIAKAKPSPVAGTNATGASNKTQPPV